MYYILFNYTKDLKKDFLACRSEQETIDFLHENYKKIRVYRIIETARSYHLGLVVTEELIKSVLEPEEEQPTGRTVMCKSKIITAQDLTDAEIKEQNKEALEKIEEKEEEEDPFETDEEKEKRIMDKGDRLIKRETEKLRVARAGWKKCPKCNRRPIAPWNTKGVCSTCQKKRKTTRPYTRRKTKS